MEYIYIYIILWHIYLHHIINDTLTHLLKILRWRSTFGDVQMGCRLRQLSSKREPTVCTVFKLLASSAHEDDMMVESSLVSWFEEVWLFGTDLMICPSLSSCCIPRVGNRRGVARNKIGSTAAPSDAIRSIFLSKGSGSCAPTMQSYLACQDGWKMHERKTQELDGWRLEGLGYVVCMWLVLCNRQWSSCMQARFSDHPVLGGR